MIINKFLKNNRINNINKKLKDKLFFLLYLIPIFIIIVYISQFGTNTPFWDQWALIPFFQSFKQGAIGLKDFFSQHNEHRIFFPKLIFITLAFASKWNLKLEMYFSIFCSILNFYFLYKIAQYSSNKNLTTFHLYNLLMGFLLFSLVQTENWLWSFQLSWFFLNTCLILAVFFLTIPNKLSPQLKLSGAALCCFIASFTLAQGIFSWLAVIPSILVLEGNKKQRLYRVLLWLILFGLCCFVYSLDYQRPGHHPSLSFLFSNPLVSLNYFLIILSNSIVTQYHEITGFLILISFLFFNFYYLKKYNSKFAIDAAPWLSIGWFAMLFTLVTTIGRAGFGSGQALSSRYTTMTILLIIACLQLWRVLINQTDFWLSKKPFKFIASYGIAGLLTLILIFNYHSQLIKTKNDWQTRLNSQSCLEVVNYFAQSITLSDEPRNCLHEIYPVTSIVITYSDLLEKLGFRQFSRIIQFNINSTKNYGEIELTSTTAQTLSKNDYVMISGWATLPETNSRPRLVLLSYDNQNSFFSNAYIIDFNQSNNTVKWEVPIYAQGLPVGDILVKAWIYDRENQQFVKLKNEVKLKVLKKI